MADLADKIDDFICVSNGYVDLTYDSIAMYLFGAFVLVFLVLAMTVHLYGKYRKSSKAVTSANSTEKAQTVNNLETKAPSSTSAKDAKEHAKNASGLLAGANKSVPSTPPSRKRLGSKSGKMNLVSTKKSSGLLVPPSATGSETESVKWVNDLLLWLYSDSDVVNELCNAWLQSLNEIMKDSVSEHGVGVELIRLIPETHPPNINNVFCECASNDDITITCDCEATAAMQLKAFRQRGEKVEVSHYRVNVNKLRGRLNILCITEKLQADVKFDGWPEIKILLAQVGTLKNNNLDEQSLQDVIVEIITSALRNNNVKLNLSQFSSCPRFKRRVNTVPNHLPLHYDSLLTTSSVSSPNNYKVGDKLLVKVVKATGLAVSKQNENDADSDRITPYCVIEVDTPPQSHHTVTLQNSTDSPTWNEHFLFNINTRSKEIMFEVYCKSKVEGEKDRFLGLAIVAVDELLERSFQRQVLSLQSRPYQNDKVSGNLVLEFTIIETTTNNKSTDRLSVKSETRHQVDYANKSPAAQTKTLFQSNKDYTLNGVTDSFSRKDEQMQYNKSPSHLKTSTPITTTNKSTLIIHSVQKLTTTQINRQPSENSIVAKSEELPVEKEENGIVNQDDNDSKENHQTFKGEKDEQHNQEDLTDSQLNDSEPRRSRSRKKRDFFGTIRKRLNRSKGRSKSVDKDTYNGTATKDEIAAAASNTPSSRSVSADRARDHSANSAHSTLGPLPREGSARSSLSEASGVSGASSKTYINESSTLILETNEDGVKKYFLVPLSMAHKTRWRKKGIKLHIFNDHTFVAKHLSLGTICQVCNRSLPKRLGKQGYECRDCQLRCHKACHVQTQFTCPNPTAQDLELSGSIKNPKIGRNKANGTIN